MMLSGAVNQPLAQHLLAVKIPVENPDHCTETHGRLVENHLPECRQAVRDAADPDHLDERVVVTRSARIIVPARPYAVVGENR
jgi:hypothetical protein